MRSSRAGSTRSVRFGDQRGVGLVEILVASAILGVAVSVMLGNLGTLVVGARVADRRTGEERLVRSVRLRDPEIASGRLCASRRMRASTSAAG